MTNNNTPATNTPQSDELDPLSRENLELLCLRKAVLKRAKETTDTQQAAAAKKLAEGEKVVIKTAWGAPLGSFSKSDPKPDAVVDDLAVILGACEPDEITYEIPFNNMDAVMKVVAEHAPELLEPRPTTAALNRMKTEALKEWFRTGKAPTGWRVAPKPGVARVTPNKLAEERAIELVDGITIHQIEAGK